MKIYKIGGKEVLDSRNKRTINVFVKTDAGYFETSAPSGKSTGTYEAPPYAKGLKSDINFLNKLKLPEILCFIDLRKVERICKKKLGANSLFALEASLLKSIARKNNKELWHFLLGKEKLKLPRPVGNAVGGGLHSKGRYGKKPDFQEFLIIPNSKTFAECVKTNEIAYKLIKKQFDVIGRNDEGAWETSLKNEEVLEIINNVRHVIKQKYKEDFAIGLDVAASSFYKKGKYCYKNPRKKINKEAQINYIQKLANKYNVYYIEDPLDENDFSGFHELYKGKCFIVGDDLTTTNPRRVKRAIKKISIDGIIIKPNQIGSLLKVKEVIDLCKEHKIKTIISHRSGETKDDTIADLCVGFGCDFIKTGIYGREREAKLNRLIDIENSLKKK